MSRIPSKVNYHRDIIEELLQEKTKIITNEEALVLMKLSDFDDDLLTYVLNNKNDFSIKATSYLKEYGDFRNLNEIFKIEELGKVDKSIEGRNYEDFMNVTNIMNLEWKLADYLLRIGVEHPAIKVTLDEDECIEAHELEFDSLKEIATDIILESYETGREDKTTTYIDLLNAYSLLFEQKNCFDQFFNTTFLKTMNKNSQENNKIGMLESFRFCSNTKRLTLSGMLPQVKEARYSTKDIIEAKLIDGVYDKKDENSIQSYLFSVDNFREKEIEYKATADLIKEYTKKL